MTSPTRIGIFGGTFDPPHEGHLAAARAAAERFSLDKVLFIPAGSPWQKEDYSSPEDRYMMTVLATAPFDGFAVSRIEVDRSGPTYTVDTLTELQAHYGSGSLFLILGADAALNMPSWRGFERLHELTEVIAVTRPGHDLVSVKTITERPGAPVIHLLEIEGIETSSTGLRAALASGEETGGMIPADVAAYIEAKSLYGT